MANLPRAPTFAPQGRRARAHGQPPLDLLGTTLAATQAPPVLRHPLIIRHRAPTRSIELLTWQQNLLESTLGIIAPSPFAPMDWANPQKRLHPVSLLTVASGRSINPPAAQSLPFNQLEWLNPRGREFPRQLRTWIQLRQDQGAVGTFEWPTPPGRDYPNRYGTFVDNSQLGVLGIEAGTPFTPIALVNPVVLARHRFQDWQHSILLSTLSLPVFDPPATIMDRPNPRGKTFPMSLRTFGTWDKLNIPAHVTPPVVARPPTGGRRRRPNRDERDQKDMLAMAQLLSQLMKKH